MMKKKYTRMILVTMALLLACSMAVIGSADKAAASSKKTYNLPTKAVLYLNDNGKMEKSQYYIFKYNKYGDVKKYTENTDDYTGTTTVKWTYKNGKPTKAVAKDSHLKTTAKFNSKGKLKTISTKQKTTTLTMKYKYNKKGYVCHFKLGKGKKINRKLKYTYHSNGIPKTIKCEGYVYTYNKKGLITKDDFATYEYKYDSKGRVKKVIGYANDGGVKTVSYKVVYTYGKAKTTSKKKYIAMMARCSFDSAWTMETACTGLLYPEHILTNYQPDDSSN